MKKTTQILSASLVVVFATPMFALADFDWNYEKWDFKRWMMERMESQDWERNFKMWKFHKKGWKHWKMTSEERIEKINSNEDLTDEEKAEKIERVQKHEEFRNMTTDEKISSINSNENFSDEQKAEKVAKIQERSERKAKVETLIENASDEIKEIHEKRKAWEEVSDDEKETMKEFFEANWIEKPERKWWKNMEWKKASWKFLDKSKKERREKFSSEDRIEQVNSNEDLTDEEKEERIAKIQEREEKMAEKKTQRVETLEKIQESVENNSNLSEEKKEEILERITNILSKFFN